ncbi:MAG: outer membrane beta-barrel protein [Alphaproteobacteria bacterium]|nr:outer membrane beta-barrel protein [Alphaproteobacteria bacterium]
MKRVFIGWLAGAATAAVFLAGSTITAAAADLQPVPPPPPPPPPFTWTGFELGLHIGGATGTNSVNVFDNFTYSDSVNNSGVFGGLHLGFNYELSSMPVVIGLQAEYNFTGIDGNTSAFPFNYLQSAVRQFGSVDGRLGYAFNNILIYAIGGFAYGDISEIINFQVAPGNPPSITGFPNNRYFDANRYGFNVGGGIEYNFYGNWTARAEYRYYDWGTRGFNDAGFFAPVTIAIPNHTTRETLQTGRIGLTYKFAWPYASAPLVAKY